MSSTTWSYSPAVTLNGQGDRARLHLFERCEGWTLLELTSSGNKPFTAYVEIGAAQGFKSEVTVDVPGWARMCFAARTVVVEAENLHGTDNEVRATVAAVDQPVPTQNYRAVHAAGAGAGSFVAVTIPAGAQAVVVQTDDQDPAVLSTIALRLKDKNGTVFAYFTYGELPDPVNLAEAVGVEVTTAVGHVLRLLFHLVF